MLFDKMFGKKKPVTVDVIDISAMHVATGQMGAYIKKLYAEENFRHIGYRFENREGMCRFVIYTLASQRDVIQYFKDRCPAMVENECRELEGVPHKWNEWESGFSEISMFDDNTSETR